MIKIEHLHKTYRSGFLMKPKLALKDVSFSVEAGQVYGFIGPNGAGKSTTIKVLTGLLNFDSGKVLVNGISPRNVKSRQFIGYSPEQPYFYDYLTGRELLQFYGKLVGLSGAELDKRIDWSLDLLHANKDWIDRRLRSYSKGMMQRVGIVSALLPEPELILADEPTSALDVLARQEVVRELLLVKKEIKGSLLCITHQIEVARQLADQGMILRQGHVVEQGRAEDLWLHPKEDYTKRLLFAGRSCRRTF